MNAIRHLFLLATFTSISFAVGAQTSVYKIDNEQTNTNTVAYYLPKSELQIIVSTKHEIEKVGPFFQYAERYLGIKDIVKEDNEQWTLTEIKLRNKSVIDSCKHFAIDVNKKTTAYNIQIAENGTLRAVNTTTKLDEPRNKRHHDKSIVNELEFDLTKLSEDALNAASTPKMAELAAKQIYAIRESRANLIAGDNDNLPDGEALKLMLAQLDETEVELTALFVGKKSSKIVTKVITIAVNEPNQECVICRFSNREGIVDADNLIGEPIYLKVDATKQVVQLPTDKKTKMGIVYNVPAKGNVTIYDLQKTWISRSITLPQFGGLNFVPAILFDEQATKIELDRFGGLKLISK